MESRKKKISVFFILFSVLYFLFSRLPVSASNHEDLLKSIEEKSKELNEINSQIQSTQKQIVETEQKGKTLKQEIKRADYRISQLNLSIKSSEIQIEKLNLEIGTLEYDISAKIKTIETKKTAITNFLRELNSKDRESVLLAFLNSKSLADGLFEAQSIENISSGLEREISSLEDIKADLENSLGKTSDHKDAVKNENLKLRGKKQITEGEKKDRNELLRVTKNQEKAYQEQLKTLEKQQDEIAKLQFGRHAGKGLVGDDRGADLGQVPFGVAGKFIVKIFGNDKFEHSVAEKLQALVVCQWKIGMFIQIRTMHNSLFKVATGFQWDVQDFCECLNIFLHTRKYKFD